MTHKRRKTKLDFTFFNADFEQGLCVNAKGQHIYHCQRKKELRKIVTPFSQSSGRGKLTQHFVKKTEERK
jgi:hypothetical protein